MHKRRYAPSNRAQPYAQHRADSSATMGTKQQAEYKIGVVRGLCISRVPRLCAEVNFSTRRAGVRDLPSTPAQYALQS